MGFKKLTNGVLRVFTDQLKAHIKKEVDRLEIPIIWWPSTDGGKNGERLKYVERHFVKGAHPKGNLVYCIITDTDSLSQIFSKRAVRQTKSTLRLYANNACVKNWFRGNSIKIYNKEGYFLRMEATINNPKSLGLKKPILYLQAYMWYCMGCNDRFANCCAYVDLTSITEDEPDRFTKPVLVGNGKRFQP